MDILIYIYDGILLNNKKEWNNAISSNMDGPRDYHTKWSKPDKDKYDITYMWSLKKKWYKWMYFPHVIFEDYISTDLFMC